MKLKRLEMEGLRNFRERTVIDFTDPLTGAPRDMVVMFGSNGSGKTTVMEVVEDLLLMAATPPPRATTIRPRPTRCALEVERDEYDRSRMGATTGSITFDVAAMENTLGPAVLCLHMQQAETQGIPVTGGLLLFPHNRELYPLQGDPRIEASPDDRTWVYRFQTSNQWHGSLEHNWVWLNYLDLENGRAEDDGEFSGALDLLRHVIGPERRIRVWRGRVRVTTPQGDEVLLDELPSGDRQCVMLFGALALQRRKGCVVMIDEPEISLHPALQRQVVHALRRFARDYDAQIIMATHSPEIVHSVSRSCVINLDYPDRHYDHTELESVAQ
jgi:ABC-type lipoprotein export system ATPase subunit